jgi:hypothetical protein
MRLFFNKVSVVFNELLPKLSKTLCTSAVNFPASTLEHITKTLLQFLVTCERACTRKQGTVVGNIQPLLLNVNVTCTWCFLFFTNEDLTTESQRYIRRTGSANKTRPVCSKLTTAPSDRWAGNQSWWRHRLLLEENLVRIAGRSYLQYRAYQTDLERQVVGRGLQNARLISLINKSSRRRKEEECASISCRIQTVLW